MTIHSFPIPSLKALRQALFCSVSSGDPWRGDARPERTVRFYSLGRWAMSAYVQSVLDKRGKRQGKVWCPDYFCNDALVPLRMMGIELTFYPVRKDLSPDWDRLESEIERSSPPDVLILVHYFGFPNALDEARTFCHTHDVELMEDCAHMLLPIDGCAEQHGAVFCPRKALALPEGALLTTPNNGANHQTDTEFGANKKLVMKWLVSRLAQRAMLSMGLSWHRYRGITINSLHSDYCEPMDGQMERFQNRYSLRLLGVQEKYLGDVVGKRRANYIRLMQAIEGMEGFRPLFPSFGDNVCPSVCPMLVSRERDTVLRQLNGLGVTAKNWPGLPPELSERRDRHEAAIWLQNHILLLPLHQDLSHKQVEYMASKLEHIRDGGR